MISIREPWLYLAPTLLFIFSARFGATDYRYYLCLL